jgi:cytochrome c biogenesis protein CcmG/thiol:disulfide interchange protein DsbE
MKRLLFAAPVVAFIAVVAFLGYGLTQDPAKLPSQLIDKPLPAFDLPGVPGAKGFTSASLAGEPALLNIFASWCVPCRAEHPVLTRIAGEGVPVYGIAWKDKPDASAALLARMGNPYRAAALDESGRTGIDLGITGVPESFVLDRHGRVRFKQIGPITAEVWDSTLKPLIAKLRAEA